MSWDGYITNLMGKDGIGDAVIAGHELNVESVWASQPNGTLSGITAAEIKVLVGTDRSKLFGNGVTVAGIKCTVLRDTLNTESVWTMDMRTKATDSDPTTYSISVAKSGKALVIAKGKKDIHGGVVNKAVFEMCDYLRKSGY
ncbi:profilin-1 [Sardina pilchardus]|uniref:profilin-1 n=1 Tax=Sardina pilchardus TaxID=27697 RepID=UPI002E0F2373